jgi:hypothetical protein
VTGAGPDAVVVREDGRGGDGPRWRSTLRRLITPERRSAWLYVVEVAGLGLGTLRAADLFLSHLFITKDLYGEPLGTSAVELQRFPWEAATCLALLAAGTAAAFVARRAGAALLGMILLVAGAGIVLAAGTQLDIWQIELPEPAVEQAPDRSICRSGGDSSECLGG